LSRASFDILAVDANAAHVRAVRERGLVVTGPIETFTRPLPVTEPGEVRGIWDTIFLCVKAGHTEQAVRQLAPHLAREGVVVSLQNGFNELTIAKVVGLERTMGAFINFGADVLEPGTVHFAGRGAVVLGEFDGRESERLARVHRALLNFEPGAITTNNIWGYLWGKMGYGALLFASALTPDSIVDVLASQDARPVLIELAREVMTVAALEGVTPMGFNGYDPAAFGPHGTDATIDASFDAMVAFNRRSAKTHSGIWRDIAVHHRKTETDAQFAPVMDIAERNGIPTPRVRRLIELMRDIEGGSRPQVADNLRLIGLQAGLPPSSLDSRVVPC
jgi:2-dehydropantoate 2-reductase